MKKNEKQTLRTLSSADLVKQVSDVETAITKMRVERYSKQSKNVREAAALKRKLAILRTFIREKELYGKES